MEGRKREKVCHAWHILEFKSVEQIREERTRERKGAKNQPWGVRGEKEAEGCF